MFNFLKAKKEEKVEETEMLNMDELMKLSPLEVFEKADSVLAELKNCPNKINFENTKTVCAAVVKKIDEIPLAKRGMVAGVPTVINSTIEPLEQVLSYGQAGAAQAGPIIDSLKTSIAFAAKQLG